MLKHKYKAAVG